MVLGIFKKALVRSKTRIVKHIAGEVDVNDVTMFLEAEPRRILQAVIEKKVPAIMSYLSRGKWYVAKILLTDLGANMLIVQVPPRKEPRPINIQAEQPVGISLKYGYGKFIFETTVLGFGPSPNMGHEPYSASQNQDPTTSGGRIVLAVPERIELVQRRSYFRVDVPSSLKVNVSLWHRCYSDTATCAETSNPRENACGKSTATPERYWQGRLTDISAGGAQIVVDNEQKPDFRKNQFVGLRFTPMPYETPLILNAQIRNILPTADGKSICIGLQLVGLEASTEGRSLLHRLCNVVEQYYRMNQPGVKQHDMQPHRLVGGQVD